MCPKTLKFSKKSGNYFFSKKGQNKACLDREHPAGDADVTAAGEVGEEQVHVDRGGHKDKAEVLVPGDQVS